MAAVNVCVDPPSAVPHLPHLVTVTASLHTSPTASGATRPLPTAPGPSTQIKKTPAHQHRTQLGHTRRPHLHLHPTPTHRAPRSVGSPWTSRTTLSTPTPLTAPRRPSRACALCSPTAPASSSACLAPAPAGPPSACTSSSTRLTWPSWVRTRRRRCSPSSRYGGVRGEVEAILAQAHIPGGRVRGGGGAYL